MGSLDLEASEMAIRAAMHQLGGVLLEKLLNADAAAIKERTSTAAKATKPSSSITAERRS